MSYIVNFTDQDNKTPITVFDNTANTTETSLTLPGRNVTGYGQIIAENFLHLLENFAAGVSPDAPVEGQLWYDSESGILQIYDGVSWKAASNIQKGPVEPGVEESKVGELWVDTSNQQLRIYTGARWILVGPVESTIDGLRYGPAIEKVDDTDNVTRVVLIFYVADIAVIIFSKDSFTPKVGIPGFINIRSGININTPGAEASANFLGGFLPKLNGIATSADSLNIGGAAVEAGKFLRSDTDNTTDFRFNVRNNNGITLGVDGSFNLSTTATTARIYNSVSGSSIDFQTNRDGIPTTVVRILENNVGINKAAPEVALDVNGTVASTGPILISNTVESTNLNNGSFRTAGGVAISKNLIVGTSLQVSGLSQLTNIEPAIADAFDLGITRRWNAVRAKTIIADEIRGTLTGNIDGNANTATSLKSITSFRLAGDVTSNTINFDGRPGESTKVFNTALTANIIVNRPEPFPNRSERTDFVLVYRPREAQGESSGLLKQSRNTFIGDLGVPIGAIMPYAGRNIPLGYLLCDGSEVDRAKYPELFDVLGNTYNGSAPLLGVNTFRLPDLRGRVALGRDNMDNNLNVPTPEGSVIDAGGGNVDRVPGDSADLLGGAAGQSSVALTLGNLPDHTHNLRIGNTQFSAVRLDTAISPPAVTGNGPTAAGQAQYLNNSGGVSLPSPTFQLGTPIGIMNPYLTINYIIRSGPPVF